MRAKAIDVLLRKAGGTLGILAVALAASLTGCASDVPAPAGGERPPRTLEPVFDGAPTLPPADLSGDGPGTLVESEPLGYSAGFAQVTATAAKMTYRSTSGLDGRETEVSGVVVVPPGEPPRDGWPVVAVGHILTGVIPQCAPSLADELGGYASILSVFASNGYAVVMSDYEGLGADGVEAGLQHLPLQAETLGNNLIDSVRAAQRVVPTLSTRWAAYGIGQGGLAAWAAADRAPVYGQGLDMVGAVALSPLADMSRMAEEAEQGVLLKEQYYLYLSVLESLARSPYGLNVDDYTSPRVREIVDVMAKCAPLDQDSQLDAVEALGPDDIRPVSSEAAAKLRDDIAGAAVPLDTGGDAAPVLVVYATEDKSVKSHWIADAARAACEQGDPVEVNARLGDLTTSNDLVTQLALGWIQARFDGQRLADVCVGLT